MLKGKKFRTGRDEEMSIGPGDGGMIHLRTVSGNTGHIWTTPTIVRKIAWYLFDMAEQQEKQ